MADMIATLCVGDEGFGSIRGPFDRPAHLFRGPGHQRLFRIVEDLRAEAAADIGGDNTQLVLGDAQHEGAHQQPDHMRVLAGRIERVFAGRPVVIADRGARFHGIWRQPLIDDVNLGDVMRLGKGGIDRRLVADMPVEAGIVLGIRPDLGGTRLVGIGRRDDGRQLLVAHLNGFGCVAGLGQGLADDQRDLIADMTHTVLAQREMWRLDHWAAILAVDLPAAGNAALVVIGAGENADDTGHGFCLRRVDLGDLGMGMRRAQDIGIGLARARDVIGIGAAAGQKTKIFLALR